MFYFLNSNIYVSRVIMVVSHIVTCTYHWSYVVLCSKHSIFLEIFLFLLYEYTSGIISCKVFQFLLLYEDIAHVVPFTQHRQMDNLIDGRIIKWNEQYAFTLFSFLFLTDQLMNGPETTDHFGLFQFIKNGPQCIDMVYTWLKWDIVLQGGRIHRHILW